MAHSWTREERRRHTTDFYYDKRRKIAAIIGVIVVFLVLGGIFSWSVKSGDTTGLGVLMAFAMVIFASIAVFILDMIFFETL
jgi:membrane protein CcdC involved in cytochrome C biogenesis